MRKEFKLFCILLGLFIISPLIVKAEGLPGARSATSEAGDVFLGGNYIEVGISKSGSFGTSSAAPADFHSHALSQYNYKLGLIADGDGWDVGNPPTSGDFFLPGTPYEGYIFSYIMNGTNHEYRISERTNSTWSGKTLVAPNVEDQSDITNNKLKALFSVVTNENVKLELTIEFGVNDIYYSTLVKITNLSSNQITNVNFTRDLDPDNDKDLNGTFDTYNKVACNPNPDVAGSDTNYAMVVAVGPVTYNGFFFVSFDNRAKGYISNAAPSNLPTYATEEILAISSENINGYSLNDVRIQLATTLNNLSSNESDETIFYSSLDPNVISSISNILKAVSASVKKYTDNRIEIETQEGYEYSIDGGEHWQDSGVFEGLEPGHEYTILARIKATPDSEASEPEETTVTTKNSSPETPDIKALSVTEDSITVQEMPGYEYSIDGGEHWQTSPSFTNLNPDTEYEIIARYKETDSTMYGTYTNPVIIRTLKKEEDTVLDTLTNVNITITLSNDSPIIGLNKGELFEAISDDETIQNALNHNDNIEIKFVVKDVEISEEDEETIKDNLNSTENIGFTIDASIKVYINGSYVKDITEPDNEILFRIKIPEELLVPGRKFFLLRSHINPETGELEVTRVEGVEFSDNSLIVRNSKFSNFTVIYDDTLQVPKTADNIKHEIIMLIISLICITTSGTSILKRKLGNS